MEHWVASSGWKGLPCNCFCPQPTPLLPLRSGVTTSCTLESITSIVQRTHASPNTRSTGRRRGMRCSGRDEFAPPTVIPDCSEPSVSVDVNLGYDECGEMLVQLSLGERTARICPWWRCDCFPELIEWLQAISMRDLPIAIAADGQDLSAFALDGGQLLVDVVDFNPWYYEGSTSSRWWMVMPSSRRSAPDCTSSCASISRPTCILGLTRMF